MTATAATLPTYVATSSLPDDKGKALLTELGNLYSAIHFSPETNRKVRSGSNDERWAVAALRTALINAAAGFQRHEDFRAWLNQNQCYHLEAYDPIFDRRELTNEIADLKWRVEQLEESERFLRKALMEIYLRLPRERADTAERDDRQDPP
jgi:hypothetical protein